MDGGSSGAHSSGERVNLGHLGPVVAVSVVRTSRSVFDGVFYLVARLISVALELIDAGEPDHYGGENNQPTVTIIATSLTLVRGLQYTPPSPCCQQC